MVSWPVQAEVSITLKQINLVLRFLRDRAELILALAAAFFWEALHCILLETLQLS